VSHIRTEAETQKSDSESQRLIQAARHLADATNRMIDAAKTCATSPQNVHSQYALKEAAEGLRSATSVAAREHLRRQVIWNLKCNYCYLKHVVSF